MKSLEATLQQAWAGRGWMARLLWPLSLLMRVLVAARRAGYRLGVWPRQRLPVPVIVVGNLVAGGAGKDADRAGGGDAAARAGAPTRHRVAWSRAARRCTDGSECRHAARRSGR